ncbi:patatin-like phospholipase family protein [Sphingomonas changnyeongensis]|uniref:Patatin-like phospholipase family protein n=1 Tax=Sphingomonas changnyeongensis TaxID=2698679 RepID=A0A7Z2NVV2_9SPHN|nr:patatin-like phospholipase family protein [Sphingomonas changnyeongensis]QHL90354.1 patatin-like phospholipase family protein [Sphingomonas changnyeongensis]
MADADPPSGRPRRRSEPALPLPECVALVLQGGGALGAYQAGVYQALDQRGIAIDRIAGISIGAVNAAIIAGNPPERRVAALREFWSLVTSWLPSFPALDDPQTRQTLHEWSAGFVALMGVPGFFAPRPFPPALARAGTPDALSFYDSRALARTLDRLIDWDLLNDGPVHVSVGVVEIESGNFRYFSNRRERLDARHIMASGALPPGLPPVEIDGRLYWDGGLVSNTPLQEVMDTQSSPMLVFQVDLFPAEGRVPRTMEDVIARAKEIRFSSRTRQVGDQLLRLRKERELIRRALAKLPAELCGDPDIAALKALAEEHPVNIVHLIHRPNAWEGDARDYEFSTRTMREHWAAGHGAVMQSVNASALLARNILNGETAAFDLTRS